ncbi:MAG: hypothetical protein AAGF95_05655 [Chloroflexota bacterium]
MYQFEHRRPLELIAYPEPIPDDRTGTPLSQGVILTLINTVAAEYCSPETRNMLNKVEPNTWYHGQELESVLNEFEDQDPDLPEEVGKNIYYMLRKEFEMFGIKTPSDIIMTLPIVWKHVTRGDSGEWRPTLLGPGKARVEMEVPYNCQFEQGAVQGALECFDAIHVQIDHTQCMRKGAPFCVLEITWEEEKELGV